MRVPIAAGVEVDVDSNRLTAEHYRYIESLDARLDEGEGVEVVRLAEAGNPDALSVLTKLIDGPGLPTANGTVQRDHLPGKVMIAGSHRWLPR
jgi:hypothetical protein